MSGPAIPAPAEPRSGGEAVVLADYDPGWPTLYESEAAKVRRALGAAAMELHHAGSTSVPGLAAKPILDMVLEVADTTDEASYAPALEAAGYAFRVREPDWFEHRMFRGAAGPARLAVNLHVFSAGCPEITRMLAFRDRLRGHAEDRRLYEETKRVLAARPWRVVQEYADAKSEVVSAIMARVG